MQSTPIRRAHREQLLSFDGDEKRSALLSLLAERKAAPLGRECDTFQAEAAPTSAVASQPPKLALPAPDSGTKAAAKKVLIISSRAGAGHQAAAQAICGALAPTYSVVETSPFDFDYDIPGLGAIHGVDLYNQVQAHGPPLCLDIMGGAQRLLTPFEDYLHMTELKALMARHKPDVIISVVPMGNSTVSKIARAQNIPMIVVPTDLDFSHFVHAISDPGPDFRLALPFPQLRTQAPHLPETAFAITGYPLRKAFCATSLSQTRETTPILERLQITPQCRVILIMIGGGGVAGDRIQPMPVASVMDWATRLCAAPSAV